MAVGDGERLWHHDVRPVNWAMEHDQYPEVLEVGCNCAGYMEADRQEAKNRERTLKNRVQRRAKWPTRKWRVSANSHLLLRTQGYRVVVRRIRPGWTFTIARDYGPPHHAAATFPTSDAAKLAAFDFIWPAASRVM